MPSKVKILPSDVLLLIIDYLDSPSMMDSRQVCKSWLDVVDGNRSLWDYFYVSNEKNRSTTLKMLKTFSSKSNHSMKAFELHTDTSARENAGSALKEKPSEKEKQLEKDKKAEVAAQIIQTLLQSQKSLKVWSDRPDGSNFELVFSFLENLHTFQNLKSFCGVDQSGLQISSRFPCQNSPLQSSLPSGSLPSIFRILSKFAVPMSIFSVLQASTSTLVHLKLSITVLAGLRKVNFPRLRILELVGYTNKFDKKWKSPNLKLLSVGLGGFGLECSNLVNHFPSSVEEIWLVASFLGFMMASFSKRGLSTLKKYYPKVEKLRFDSHVAFIPAEVISVVQARKEAFRKGFEVEGVKLKPIKTLTLDFKRLRPDDLSSLQKLVPEVVDAGIASKEVIVDC